MATASDVERELLRSDTEHNVSELPSQASSRHMLQDIAKLLVLSEALRTKTPTMRLK